MASEKSTSVVVYLQHHMSNIISDYGILLIHRDHLDSINQSSPTDTQRIPFLTHEVVNM